MTNDVICASNKMEMFVTVWMGILEISTGKITAANAATVTSLSELSKRYVFANLSARRIASRPNPQQIEKL